MAQNNTSTFKNMNINSVIDDIDNRIEFPEQMLARALNQPFANTNSGSRKLMFSTHLEQRLPLLNPEIPLVGTGYESEFGRFSSSFKESPDDYVVLKKIYKFGFLPEEKLNHDYILIIQNVNTRELDFVERKSYTHITESYGYLNNNTYLDGLKPIDEPKTNNSFYPEDLKKNTISKGDVYSKSMAYDNYNNRIDGVNLLMAYMSTAKNTEDSVIISESAAKKLTSPLIKPIKIIINDNDILLNLYGKDFDEYKTFPDIGEEIENGILCSVRREKKEESLFTQSYQRLKDFFINDDKFSCVGEVIDIDIYCNNPETINNSVYSKQLKKYYDNSMRYYNEIITNIDSLIAQSPDTKLSYDLSKLYTTAKKIVSGSQFIYDRPFTGTILDITVMERNNINIGDKASNRYGGKGVISYILPDNEMPYVPEKGEYVDIIYNSNTCLGRLNPGQMFETSITFIGARILEYIQKHVTDIDSAMDLIREYIVYLSPEMDTYLEECIDPNNEELFKEMYLESLYDTGGIAVSLEPISDSITIYDLDNLYSMFPMAKQYEVLSPIKDSNGNIRYVKGNRPMVVSSEYIYRLKQYAKDKFSVTSLSATNIRNQNARSKSNKQNKAPYSKTPIREGDMEISNMLHMGPEITAMMLMLYSSSPHGRRMTESMYTGDPFDIDIKLDETSKNRNVEIINARFKTMGLKLVFKKVPKKSIVPVERIPEPIIRLYEPLARIVEPIARVYEDKDTTIIPVLERIDENDKDDHSNK